MDWTKAKTILIVALIATNLVLIATYLYQNNGFKSDDQELQDVTIKLLESKGIYVDETKIPKEHPRMAKLTVEFDKMNEDVINEQLENQKPLTLNRLTDKKLKEITAAFIKNCNLMTDNVTFDSIERTEKGIRVTYKNYIDGIAIEDSYIICTITNGKITDVKRYWLNPVEISENKKEVISAAAALIKFMSENKTEEKKYVQDISLVYYLDSSSFDVESPVSDTAFPSWKITFNRGRIQYVPAWEQ